MTAPLSLPRKKPQRKQHLTKHLDDSSDDIVVSFFFRLEKLIKVARKLKVDAASRAIKRQGQMKGGRERKVRALSTSKNGKSGKDFAS